jgi:hypothetical protein
MWDPDTCEQIPFSEGWEASCPLISLVAYNKFLLEAAKLWGLMSLVPELDSAPVPEAPVSVTEEAPSND